MRRKTKRNSTEDIYRAQALLRTINGATGWFYAIGIFSLINSVLYYMSSNLNFLVGLGTTQLVDGFARGFANAASSNVSSLVSVLGLSLSLVISAGFIAFGYFTKTKLIKWVFLLGIVLYAFDGLILLFFGVWLNLAFHIFALVILIRGYTALNQYLNLGTSVIRGSKKAEAKIQQKQKQNPKPNPTIKLFFFIIIGFLVIGTTFLVVMIFLAEHGILK